MKEKDTILWDSAYTAAVRGTSEPITITSRSWLVAPPNGAEVRSRPEACLNRRATLAEHPIPIAARLVLTADRTIG